MVKENGVFYMRTAQERELEKRVKDRKQELMENYRAQKEERRETVASKHITNTKTQRSIDRGEVYITFLERKRREERDVMEGIRDVSQVYNGLHSTPAPERQSYSEPPNGRQVMTPRHPVTPRYRLNAGKKPMGLGSGSYFCTKFCSISQYNKSSKLTRIHICSFYSVDGAVLSQMSEVKSSPKQITTCKLTDSYYVT